MIALDTSAIVAILLSEPEEEVFQRIIARERTMVGAPTLVEARLVLEGKFVASAEATLLDFLSKRRLDIVSFDASMFELASSAFARFGKGRGHPAKLNFGDCLSYAVAKAHGLPLLFKGDDFGHTDIVPAYNPDP